MGTPEVLGPYVIYERLGAGGMATVHRAEQIGLAGFRKQVALKRLLPHIASDPKMVKMFTHEARLASQLRHGNVAQIYDLGKHEDTYFIAMEYIPGPTVTQIMKQCGTAAGSMPVPIVLSILGQVCDALDHAHNLCDDSGTPLGIIHRDVSPANLIVSSTGVVKLIDFGIAKITDAGENQTQAGFIKGKYAYIAPEYTLGHLDLRADLFGLGVIAHELLTTRRLFNASSDFETIKRLREMPIQPPSRWNPQIPLDVDDIVMTALQRDPSLRWQSASAMRTAIHNAARSTDNIVTNQQLAEWVEWCFGRKPIKQDTDLNRAIDTLGDSTSGSSELDTDQRIELEVLGAVAGASQATIPDEEQEVEPPTPVVQDKPAPKSLRPGPRSEPRVAVRTTPATAVRHAPVRPTPSTLDIEPSVPTPGTFDSEQPTRAFDNEVATRAFDPEPPTRVVASAYSEPLVRTTASRATPIPRTSAHVIQRGAKDEAKPDPKPAPPPIKPYNARTAGIAERAPSPAPASTKAMPLGGPRDFTTGASTVPRGQDSGGSRDFVDDYSTVPRVPEFSDDYSTVPRAPTPSPTAPRVVPVSLPLGGPAPKQSGSADRATVIERMPVMPPESERAKRPSQMPHNAIALVLPPEQRAEAERAEAEHEANREAQVSLLDRAVKAARRFPVDEDSGVVVSAAPARPKTPRSRWLWIGFVVVLLAAGACAYLYFVEGLVPDI